MKKILLGIALSLTFLSSLSFASDVGHTFNCKYLNHGSDDATSLTIAISDGFATFVDNGTPGNNQGPFKIVTDKQDVQSITMQSDSTNYVTKLIPSIYQDEYYFQNLGRLLARCTEESKK